MTTDTVGGVLTYTIELAAELEAHGDAVVVAALGPAPRADQLARLPAALHRLDVRLEWMEDPWEDVEASERWLLELEAQLRPDVVHLCSYAHGTAPFRAPKVLVAHSCVLSWWRAVHGEQAPAEWDAYRAAMRAGLQSADAVVAPTHAMLAEVEQDHGPTRGWVIHNGSAAPEASADVVKHPLILGSGRLWDAAKGLTTLDEAARGLPWPVLVAGDVGRGAPPEHANGTGVLDQAQLTDLRRRAAIYCAPALYEPFGLGILEAARDRCALVLGDIPSLRELWDGAAVFVDPRDPRALRAALEELIADRSRREQMAAAAHRHAARYSIERSARAYRRLYGRLAAARAAGVAA